MNSYRCLIIEDDWFAIEMMADYVGRHRKLVLVGIVQQLSELPQALMTTKPDIVFLDLVIPQGAPTDFHYGLISPVATVVVVSAIPALSFNGTLPPIAAELLKPLSYESFKDCIDQICEQLKP